MRVLKWVGVWGTLVGIYAAVVEPVSIMDLLILALISALFVSLPSVASRAAVDIEVSEKMMRHGVMIKSLNGA